MRERGPSLIKGDEKDYLLTSFSFPNKGFIIKNFNDRINTKIQTATKIFILIIPQNTSACLVQEKTTFKNYIIFQKILRAGKAIKNCAKISSPFIFDFL